MIKFYAIDKNFDFALISLLHSDLEQVRRIFLSRFREIPLPNRDKQFGISYFRSNFANRNQR